jgi:phosphomannomutase
MSKINENVLLPRCEDENHVGLVAEKGLDCKTVVVKPNGVVVEAVDYEGVKFIPCNVGDSIILHYNKDKSARTFKVVDIERSGHFFVCEIIYDEEEMLEMELLIIAEQVVNGNMTTNNAHLKADQLLVSFLYRKGFTQIADAFNKVPKYYE